MLQWHVIDLMSGVKRKEFFASLGDGLLQKTAVKSKNLIVPP